MQRRPNSWAATQLSEWTIGLVSKSAIAFSIPYAMRLSLPSAILFGLFFTMIFVISGSIARGLTNFFLSIALSSVFSSIFFFFKIEIDPPLIVFIGIALFALVFSHKNANDRYELGQGTDFFDSIAALVLLFSAYFFRQITHLESTKLFGMLLPEDNAAWIHASSGFVRFNASSGFVTSLQYGTSSFTSNLLSALSVPTKFLSSENGPVLSLANTANTYVFLIMVLIYMSSAACRKIFYIHTESSPFRSAISNGKFVLIGVFSAISVGKIFINSGHLSLILSVVTFWVVSCQFHTSSSLSRQPGFSTELWSLNLAMLSAFAIGTVWFPLIPVSFLTIACIIITFIMVRKDLILRHYRQFLNISVGGNLIMFAVIIFAALTQLQVPTGYSVSSLVNVGSGGTMTPSVIGLSIALVGFIIAVETEGKNVVMSIFFSLFPLGLLAYWVMSMSANPTSPGYSVEKFSLLVALIGLPLVLGFVFSYSEKALHFRISSVITPLLLAFSLATASWGINSFPRLEMIDQDNWTINYLPSLLNQSEANPAAHLLCLSGSPDSDMTAYTCSRFGSALQFKETSNNNLARRWRSQVLDTNVDPVIFPKGTIDFAVPSNINNLLNNGGNLVVVMTPGPFWQIEQRLDRAWMQELPWESIQVIE